ncbi:MAG TPA: helix-hairpin-helix domain-containing protein [Gammaproteobacteria bacterium]|nr:helix-hairpin-helix domain-containing protein [Gammaproteobacteria bacterium]
MANLNPASPSLPRRQLPDNAAIADALERIATLLEQQQANPYRVQAYRTAAGNIRLEPESLAEQGLAEGTDALERIPGIGPRIARHIDNLIHTGRIPLLEQLQGEANPERLLTSVPGIGVRSAREIHSRLGISSLEELELAAHDGRLRQIPGFGPRRIAGLRHTLGNMLSRRSRARAYMDAHHRPPVALLLEVDADYRAQAAAGRLPQIAPRRFNPNRQAWLPVLHTERQDWSFTALYSNTARAHRSGRTRDWVVVFYEHDDISDQATIVTAVSGSLRGRRVVRGREVECLDYYGLLPGSAEPAATQPPTAPGRH